MFWNFVGRCVINLKVGLMVIYGDNLNWFNVKIAGKIVYEFLEI